MRHIVFFPMALQIVSVHLMATETECVHQVKQLLIQTENIDSGKHKGDVEFFIEGYSFGYLRDFSEFDKLQKVVSENWKEVLASIEVLSLSETHQAILFLSFLSLPLEDSFQCLNKMADLCLHGMINKDMFRSLIVTYEVYTMPKRRLSLNNKNPIVAEMLRKAKLIDPQNNYYLRIASGEEKKKLTNFWYDPDTGTHLLDSIAGSNAETYGNIIQGVLIGVVAIICAVVAWRYSKRKDKSEKYGDSANCND